MSAANGPRGGHVLVARLDSLGDVLLAGGAVRGSARRVIMMVAPGQEATASLLPGVDDVIAFDAAWVPLNPRPVDHRATRRLIRTLRRRRVEAAMILTSFHQSPLPLALLLRLAGVSWIGAISEDYPGVYEPEEKQDQLHEMVPFMLEVMNRIVVGRRLEEVQIARFARQQWHDWKERQSRMQPDPIKRPPACRSAECEVRPERRDFPSAQQQCQPDRGEDEHHAVRSRFERRALERHDGHSEHVRRNAEQKHERQHRRPPVN